MVNFRIILCVAASCWIALVESRTIGIIGGSSLFHSKAFQTRLKERIVNENVRVYEGVWTRRNQAPLRIVFCQRHHAEPEIAYRQPAQIDYKAITLALKVLKCDQVIGVYSVGSMDASIPIGQLVLPDDYFAPFSILHHSDGYEAHTVPGLSESMRTAVAQILQTQGMAVRLGGVYVQANGPRFETKAEIRFFKTVGEYVGMTGAHEAELLNELQIPFAMIGIVDNMANGIEADSEELTLEKFKIAQKQNGNVMEKAITAVLDEL